jgi:hypothetical protein
MKNTVVRIPDNIFEKIEEEMFATGSPVVTIIRRALEDRYKMPHEVVRTGRPIRKNISEDKNGTAAEE